MLEKDFVDSLNKADFPKAEKDEYAECGKSSIGGSQRICQAS